MNDKLKREFKRLKITNKKICVRVCASDYSEETMLYDEIAVALERGMQFIQLEQGEYGDGKFLDIVKKVSQLSVLYEFTLVLSGSLAVSFFAQPDGVMISEGDLKISEVKELLGNEKIIGYSCRDIEEAKFAIKSGADYLIISTPSIPTKDVVIEYAKWVYENIDIPVFLEVDSQQNYAILNVASIDKIILSIKHLDSILHTP